MLPLRRTKATTASFSTVRGVVYGSSTTPSMVRCSRVPMVASNWLLVLQRRVGSRSSAKTKALQQHLQRKCSEFSSEANSALLIRRRNCRQSYLVDMNRQLTQEACTFVNAANQKENTDVIVAAGIQTCEENSTRASNYLRRSRQGSSTARRSASRGSCDGSLSEREWDSVASRGRSGRVPPNPRTAREPSTPLA